MYYVIEPEYNAIIATGPTLEEVLRLYKEQYTLMFKDQLTNKQIIDSLVKKDLCIKQDVPIGRIITFLKEGIDTEDIDIGGY